MIPSFFDKSLIPHKSGIYVYKDKAGKVLYVGKAIDLYHRVSSYFTGSLFKGVYVAHPKGGLVERIAKVETIIVELELEALILEANLIKKYRPPFNIRLMDDKDYIYIGITKEDLPAGRQGFPKIITIRKQDLKMVKKYFGPFPSGKTVKNTLKMLRRVFPWCSDSSRLNLQSRIVKSIPIRDWKLKPCFYYHLGLCPGACVGLIEKTDYNKIINRFSKFLEGKKDELVADLSREMNELSKEQKYENADKLKKILSGIAYLTQTNRVQSYLENPNFLEDETNLALLDLQKNLNLKQIPERIEGYDISNIGGKQAVGSLVVLTHGEIDKSQYRKFKIHPPAGGSGKPNDVGMMGEMIRRRLAHAEWPKPDLLLVDGGRGQARGANVQCTMYNVQIPIFGLAKRLEWLYPPEGEVLKLPKHSLSLKLLQKLRDESHRFAITYHRKLRDRIR